MCEEIFSGIAKDPDSNFKTFHETFCDNYKEYQHNGFNKTHSAFIDEKILRDECVVVENIPVYSVCEHHLLPFWGEAKVGYVPTNKNIIGLSKIARVVDGFSRRLQVQERLTTQIANLFFYKLNAKAVVVIIEAEHLCMTMRGIKARGAKTRTVVSREREEYSATSRINILKTFLMAEK
jgi:GTP cyclohydrolase I